MNILSTTSKLMGILTISSQTLVVANEIEPKLITNKSLKTLSVLKEANKVREELYVVNAIARYKNEQNEYIEGKIFIKIEHRKLTPEYQNKLNGEMVGLYYFESNEEVIDYGDGKKYKIFINLTGDDGETLFDLTHKDQDSKKFQLYGCNSTWTACSPELSEITFFKNGNVEIDINLPSDKNIEVFQSYTQRDIDGNVKTIEYWTASPRSELLKKI